MSKVKIYLGQVQTTRRIKKLVLTGTENWTDNGLGTSAAFFQMTLSENENQPASAISSHFAFTTISSSTTAVGVYITSLNHFLRIRPTNADTYTLDSFKSFLAEQYAAGTPVTVWYVLANEQTGTVNEPLCKIGNYSDTVASTNTGAPSIPTVSGSNTLSIGTTLQPSEVSITGRIKEVSNT